MANLYAREEERVTIVDRFPAIDMLARVWMEPKSNAAAGTLQ